MQRKKPIIGIIGRPDIINSNDEVICVWEKTRKAVVQKGGIPLLVLPTQNLTYEGLRPKDTPKMTEEEKQDLKTVIDCCDGLWFPGAYMWYEYDTFSYQYALEKNLPILGICAGMQIMASVDNIMQEENVKHNAINNTKIDHQKDQKYVHSVTIVDDTLLRKIIGKNKIQVNSKHNYHVQTTTDLLISAYSEDGLIEAIEHPNKKFVVGIQWHPETMLDYDESANKILDAFIEACR